MLKRRLANVIYWAGSTIAVFCVIVAVAITVYWIGNSSRMPAGWQIISNQTDKPWEVAWSHGEPQFDAKVWRITSPKGKTYWVAGPKDTNKEEASRVLDDELSRQGELAEALQVTWVFLPFVALAAWGFGRICYYVLAGT
jgi:hypothetical protein